MRKLLRIFIRLALRRREMIDIGGLRESGLGGKGEGRGGGDGRYRSVTADGTPLSGDGGPGGVLDLRLISSIECLSRLAGHADWTWQPVICNAGS